MHIVECEQPLHVCCRSLCLSFYGDGHTREGFAFGSRNFAGDLLLLDTLCHIQVFWGKDYLTVDDGMCYLCAGKEPVENNIDYLVLCSDGDLSFGVKQFLVVEEEELRLILYFVEHCHQPGIGDIKGEPCLLGVCVCCMRLQDPKYQKCKYYTHR